MKNYILTSTLIAACAVSVPAFAEDTGTTFSIPEATVTYTSTSATAAVSTTYVTYQTLTGTYADGTSASSLTQKTIDSIPWLLFTNAAGTNVVINFSGTATGEQSIATSTTAGGYGGMIGFANDFFDGGTGYSAPKAIIISNGLEFNARYVQNRGATSSSMTMYFDNASLTTTSGTDFEFNIGVGAGGLRLNLGATSNYTFSGKISGTGNIYSSTGSGVAYTNTFTGDTSEFTGTWLQSAGTRTYVFGTGTQTYTSVGGNFGAADSLVNLKFNYNSNYTIAGTIFADNLEVAGGNATFSGDITAKSFTVAASTSATLSGTITLTNAISNSGTVTVENTAHFVLDNVAKTTGTKTLDDGETVDTRTYVLISNGTINGWDSLTSSSFTVDGAVLSSRKSVDVKTTAGTVTIWGTVADLVWGEKSSGEWNYTETNKVWKNGSDDDYFVASDNVTFATTDATVTIGEAIEAKNVTVSNATTLTATSSENSLTIHKALTANAAVTLSDYANVSSESVAGTGTLSVGEHANLTVSGGISNVALTLTDYATVSAGSVTGTALSISKDAKIAVSGVVSSVTLSGAGTVDLGTTGTFSATSGSTVTLGSDWTGTVVLKDRGSRDSTTYTPFDLSLYGREGSTISLSGFWGYFSQYNDKNGVVAANIHLENSDEGFAIRNCAGSSSATMTFSGAISGDGTFRASNTNANAVVTQSFKFTGDLSKFTGTFDVVGATKGWGNLTFETNKLGNFTIDWTDTIYNSSYGYVKFITASDTTFAGTIENGHIIKEGSGTLTLSGTNSYAGDTTISAGTLKLTNASAAGTSAISIESGTLEFSTGIKTSTSADSYTTFSNTISGAGKIAVSTSKVELTGLSSFTGEIAIDSTSRLGISVAADLALTLAGEISGAGSLDKTGAGTLELSVANANYSGTTYVSAGTLKVKNAGALGTGGVSVNSYTETPILLIAANNVQLTDALAFVGKGKFAVDLDAFTINENEAITIITANAIRYTDFLDASNLTSDVVSKYFDAEASNLGIYESGYNLIWGILSDGTDTTGITLTISAIPEPSLFGLLAGTLALALAGTRRRRGNAKK